MDQTVIVGILKKSFTISDCIQIEEEYLVDLTDAINRHGVYAMNERIVGSVKGIFKQKEDMTNRDTWVESNEGDPELLIYVPFNSAVQLKSMTMIGGEDGSSPAHIKMYVNKENSDFSLVEEAVSTQVMID